MESNFGAEYLEAGEMPATFGEGSWSCYYGERMHGYTSGGDGWWCKKIGIE